METWIAANSGNITKAEFTKTAQRFLADVETLIDPSQYGTAKSFFDEDVLQVIAKLDKAKSATEKKRVLNFLKHNIIRFCGSLMTRADKSEPQQTYAMFIQKPVIATMDPDISDKLKRLKQFIDRDWPWMNVTLISSDMSTKLELTEFSDAAL